MDISSNSVSGQLSSNYTTSIHFFLLKKFLFEGFELIMLFSTSK